MLVTIHGKEFEVGAQPADFWGWVKQGRYNHEWRLLDRFLQPEMTFIDLGAWVGSHSLYASKIVKRVIAIEPDPVAYKILEANTAGVDNIETKTLAVTDHEGILTIGSSWLGASTTRANRIGGTCEPWAEGHIVDVKCTTLRNLCAAINGKLFVKMDIEGSEEQILKDYDFFAERRPVLYLSTHEWWWRNPDTSKTAIRRVASLYSSIVDSHELLPVEFGGRWIDYVFVP